MLSVVFQRLGAVPYLELHRVPYYKRQRINEFRFNYGVGAGYLMRYMRKWYA